jgi:hypothetical protein
MGGPADVVRPQRIAGRYHDVEPQHLARHEQDCTAAAAAPDEVDTGPGARVGVD